MHTSNETLRRIERLHVRAWPASETERIDGWLWRWSGGGSQRANSVSTIDFTGTGDFTGTDASSALDRIEARYRAKGSPARLHTFGPLAFGQAGELSQPPGLPEQLTARGYQAGETTVTMVSVVPSPVIPSPFVPSHGAPPENITVTVDPTPEWFGIYLDAITESRREVNRRILARIPDPRAFFTVWRDGRAISTALGVVDGGHAVAECVATREDARGQRGADSAMRALTAWAVSLGAHTIGLQVVEGNRPAMALYRRLGFAQACMNRFWVKP
jgi:GNAT superfamily N-acetyltransferase